MDDRRFDQLTRVLGGASTRRGALAALAGMAVAVAGVDVADAGKKRRKCDPRCPAGQTCRQGACACDNGGVACGASCCAAGQRCEGGACMVPPVPCVSAGAACKGVGAPCCDGFVCGSGQGGQGDVACYVPAGGPCTATAECVFDSTCKDGGCVANPQPTPVPPVPPCTPTFPVTDDPAANGLALQQAVRDAASGDTIVLAGGDYRLVAPMAFSSYMLYVAEKSIVIQRCDADAVVTIVCPDPGVNRDTFCVTVARPGSSLTLNGLTVRHEGTATGYGISATNATAVLQDVTVEVTGTNVRAAAATCGNSYDRASLTINAGVTLRTSNGSPTNAALRTSTAAGCPATITCTTEPTYLGYPPDKRCQPRNPGDITGCGCQNP